MITLHVIYPGQLTSNKVGEAPSVMAALGIVANILFSEEFNPATFIIKENSEARYKARFAPAYNRVIINAIPDSGQHHYD